MTDLELLKKYISGSGLRTEDLAEVCRITNSRMLLLLSGKVEFRASEMISLSRILGLDGEESARIFFTKEVE